MTTEQRVAVAITLTVLAILAGTMALVWNAG